MHSTPSIIVLPLNYRTSTLRVKIVIVCIWQVRVFQIVDPAGNGSQVSHEAGDPTFEQTVVAQNDVLRLNVNVVRLVNN